MKRFTRIVILIITTIALCTMASELHQDIPVKYDEIRVYPGNVEREASSIAPINNNLGGSNFYAPPMYRCPI